MAATDVHCHTLVACVVDVCVRVAPLHPHTALHTTAEAKERPSQQDQNVALLLVLCIYITIHSLYRKKKQLFLISLYWTCKQAKIRPLLLKNIHKEAKTIKDDACFVKRTQVYYMQHLGIFFIADSIGCALWRPLKAAVFHAPTSAPSTSFAVGGYPRPATRSSWSR